MRRIRKGRIAERKRWLQSGRAAMKGENMANWIWYPGDFEIYHGMCQNFDREERGFFWPAYWHIADCRHHVVFHASCRLEKETAFRVTAKGIGHVLVKWEEKAPSWFPEGQPFYLEKKYTIGEWISCPAKEIGIDVVIGNRTGLPCIYVEGEVIRSGKNWTVTDFAAPEVPVGWNDMYVRAQQDPQIFEYTQELCRPVSTERVNGGVLYDFGRELTADTLIKINGEERPDQVTLCYGESRTEALDTQLCYLKQVLEIPGKKDSVPAGCASGPEREADCGASPFGRWESGQRYHTKLRAFRYLFIPEGENASLVTVEALYKYVDFPKRSSFSCSDGLINRIWEVADTTFRLASGIFFLDGVKRDRWIWSGDAYQSCFINQYLFFDKDICKRTILALRGNDPVAEHINTIVDYSMYWIISLENYYNMSGDLDFIRMVYPRMESLLRYCMEQTDGQGFIYGREGDWIYIDWAELDKEGTLCAEQQLLARSYEAVASVRRLLGLDAEEFDVRKEALLKNIRQFFWDEEKGAFIDSYQSGRRNVTRHANIFAVLFGYADEAETESILHKVLLNEEVAAITTPYFKFYELEALAKLGRFDVVMDTLKSYWGGMLERGADTFWEEYKPEQPEEEQYGMYGDKYGKSLCHAWGASPIYLLGRYCMGVRPTGTAYETFAVEPQLELFDSFSCSFPVNEGTVWMDWKDGVLDVYTDKDGGVLKAAGKEYTLERGKHVVVKGR